MEERHRGEARVGQMTQRNLRKRVSKQTRQRRTWEREGQGGLHFNGITGKTRLRKDDRAVGGRVGWKRGKKRETVPTKTSHKPRGEGTAVTKRGIGHDIESEDWKHRHQHILEGNRQRTG